ncbi:uncharacterized protein [Dermacentor andersoni]|uniref:uncharacterized protein n=1 Tax=Dermacentor andersoni TaxID=34620 RepID=UPI0021557B31|nr:uncharacterized protein LOC126539265 [Dermacentor andersoni]
MLPYLRRSVTSLLHGVSTEPFGEDDIKAELEKLAESQRDPGTGVEQPTPTPLCDEAADDYEDGELTDTASVASETGVTEARPSKTVPGASWAAKRVRRLLAVQSAFGARFGAAKAPSAPAFSDAQTQTLPDDSTEEVHCRRCRGVYRRQRARADEISPRDAKPWPCTPSLAVAATHKPCGGGGAGAADPGDCPEKLATAHWCTRLVEPALVVASEILQYPWGADALFLVGIVLLASLLVILYYVVAVVLPIMVLAVLLAMVNSALFEGSRFVQILQRLGLT